MDIELEPPNVFSAIRFLGLQTQVIFVIQLLMTLHRHPESAIIVMSAPNIYIYEIQIKVNNKKVFAFSYILYFLLKKKSTYFNYDWWSHWRFQGLKPTHLLSTSLCGGDLPMPCNERGALSDYIMIHMHYVKPGLEP